MYMYFRIASVALFIQTYQASNETMKVDIDSKRTFPRLLQIHMPISLQIIKEP